jgi:saccharopine dehydrogenase-like NADP-dependent oxidoreductase
MAVVADSDRPMARARPGAIVISHDVAVRAGFRVIGEVGVAPGIDERVAADADEKAEERDGGDGHVMGGHAARRFRHVWLARLA